MTQSRKSRLEIISDILQHQCIRSQEDLAKELSAKGLSVTQATLSRDLKKLHTTKVASDLGGYRYMVIDPLGDNSGMPTTGAAHSRIHPAVLTMTLADNILIIKTRNGYAAGVANDIDMLQSPLILGILSGPNTVFAITRKGTTSADIFNLMGRLLPQSVVDRARLEHA